MILTIIDKTGLSIIQDRVTIENIKCIPFNFNDLINYIDDKFDFRYYHLISKGFTHEESLDSYINNSDVLFAFSKINNYHSVCYVTIKSIFND